MLALVVNEGLDLAVGGARDDRVTHRQQSLLDHHGGDRTATNFEVGFEYRALGATGGSCGELGHFGDQQHLLEQVINAGALQRRDFHADRVAAPLFGHQSVLTDLLEHAVGVGVGLVNLVDGDDDRHLGELGVVDGFDRLGHHAVVGGDNQDDDVSNFGAARSHRREGLVTRRVNEGNGLALPLHLVGPDVLGDAAGLIGRHVGLSNFVEQFGLAVVDVAHHGNDGRSRDGRNLFVLFVFVKELGEQRGLLLLTRVYEVHHRADFGGVELDHVVGEALDRRDDFAL